MAALLAPRTLATKDLALHVARIAIAFTLLVLVARFSLLGAAPFAVLLFLGAFALTHDVSHGALRIPGRFNGAVLSLAAGVMLMSGHALRRSHLHHHKAPLAHDDVEGESALYPFHLAVLHAPRVALRWTTESYRLAPPHERRTIVFETLATSLVLALLVASGSAFCRVYVAVALGMRLFMGVWASNLSHRPPRWLVVVARPLAELGSVIAKSLVHHELHHRTPSVPCARLATRAPS